MIRERASTVSITAAQVDGTDSPFVLRPFCLEAPRADEVRVRIVACGICHTDIAVRQGVFATQLPAVLGHEGSGVVEAVGDDVSKVAVGDHVVLTFLSCGQCAFCAHGFPSSCVQMGRMNFGGCREDGTHALHADTGESPSDRFFGQSAFATYAIAHERNVVKVRKDLPLELLGPLGCGVQTGAGTVFNALKVGPGDSFVAFGAGAVGLSAVMAAHAAGAATIIAVDVVPSRLALALELGATHVVHPKERDPVAAVYEITGAGANFSVDSTANVRVTRQAVEALGKMGVCAVIGGTAVGTEIVLDINDLMTKSKSIKGVIEGQSVPDTLIPRLIELYLQGRFPFDKLVKFYDFEAINDAVHDSEEGATIKPVLRMSSVL